ncbi:RHS repeat domain-containing protein, partial [Bacteroides fragilis]|uniref:RHS repeat domain-containing protein n=5 Tax=Bacteroides fragilis TaxID=817 RepID=UPI0005168857
LRRVTNERLQSYEFALDAVGNVTAEKGFDGAVRRYLRDRGGRIIRETLPSGMEREYGYDACSRVTRVSYPTAGAPDQTYAYGLSGRLVQASRGESTVEFAYNSLGLPVRETADGNTILRTYDHTGRILTLDSTAGASLRYTRNGYGELEGFTATGGSDGAGSWESAHRHDTLGFEVERILPGGIVRSFAYDDIGRLVDARTRKDSRTRHMRRYRWGVADRLLSVEDSRRGETRYSYTPTGQLERAEYPDGREQWRKSDQTGNLYPDPDMKLRRYLGGGRLEQDGEWHCEYDADGNLTERYLGTGRWLDGKKDRWRYRWNADGSLAKVVRPDKREVEFTYDALGRRLSKSFGTTVTRWVWNGNVPLHQWKQHREYSVMEDRWNTDTEHRDMTVWLFDEESFVPVAMIKEGRSYSILTDQLGTPTEAYDTEGNEVWSRVLDMDGNLIEETGNKGMIPFLFQGQYYDRETGLAYNRFRYYSPQMGMYVSQDPIGLGGGILNLYGYVDDTNVWIDSFGLDWNYVLINSKENVFYSGRASDNANLSDVARRHAGTKGADGTRFGNGDTLVQITKPQITSYAAARGVEQFGIMNSSTPLLGYRSTNVRGNKIAGISSSNRNIEIYMSEGESVINGKTLADMIAKGKKMTFEEYQTKKTYKK